MSTSPKAEQIEFIPGGGLVATNLQAALNELDSDKATTANLAAPSGSSLVGYLPSGTGAVATTVQSKLRESVSVKDFGASPLKTAAENAAAFALAAAYVSSISGELVFPAETYSYSGGLEFTNPVKLRGEGATLNYTGTGKAVKLGPDGLTVSNYQTGLYEVTGLKFTGGALTSHGIYVNEFVVYSSIHNNYFVNFGNATSYAVFFQASNWRCEVTNNNYISNDGAVRNFLWVRGKGVTSGTDYGQSKLLMVGNNVSNVSASGGIGCWISGVASIATCNKIEGFAPAIRVSPTATFTQIVNNYFENAVGSTTGAVEFGDPAGGDSPSAYLVGLRVSGCYCNTHNADPSFSSTSKLLAPSGTLAGLQDSFVIDNTLTQITAGTEVVKLNNLASQLRNVGDNNRCYSGSSAVAFYTHTLGASITNWVGVKLDNPIESNVVRDSLVQHVLQGGKTAHQYIQLLFKSYNGAEIGVLQGFNGQDIGLNATNDLYVTADNRVWVGKTGKQIGFFGASPQSKPTVSGSRGGNAALGSLITALANLGLLTDSTSV